MIRKVEKERFSVTSSKPFDDVVAAIKTSIGHPNMAELWQATRRATTAAELEAAIQPALGESGLMQFVEFDHGMIVRKGTEHHISRIIRLVIGNPLIMKEMAKRVPDAGSYAPVIQVRSRNIKMRPRWFTLDWILSFFVSLDDQIARINRMKASILFVILARSGPKFCSRQIPLKNVTIKPARESLSSRTPRAAARLSMSS